MNLTPVQAEFLSEPNICVFATADAAGRPHAVPVWYLYEEDSICVIMEKGSKKHRNLMENPNISLAIDRRSSPYFALMINGPADVEGETTYEDIIRIAIQYLGQDEGKAYADSLNPSDLILVRLRSGRVVEHMAG